MSCFLLKGSFNFRVSIVRDIRRTAVTELFRILKMTLRVIFSILNNLSLRRNINLNIRKFTKANKPLFWQKWTPDVFSYFPAAMFVPLRGTQTWRLHTKLYKFMWNILSKNSSTECCTDLTIGQMPYLFILYTMSISWLHSGNGFDFFFSMAWQWKPRIVFS